LKTPTRRT